MLHKTHEYFTLNDFERTYLNLYKHLQMEDNSLTFAKYLELLIIKYTKLYNRLEELIVDEQFTVLVDTYFKNIWFLVFFKVNFGFVKERKVNYEDFKKLLNDFIQARAFEVGDCLLDSVGKICQFISNEKLKLSINTEENKKINTNKRKVLKDTEKLALAHELGFFELLESQNMPDDKINRIMGLFLDKDPKEFVYKNLLNINSKNPNYQTDKYTAYQYLEPMKKLIDEL